MVAKRRYKPGEILILTWRDHFSNAEEVHVGDVDDDCVYVSVGWFQRENDHYIYLVRDRSVDTEGSVAAVLAVAKALILEVESVKAA